jgi:hypothetical protein
LAESRTETDDLVNLVLGEALPVETVRVNWPAELDRPGRIQCNDSIVRSARSTVPLANIAGGVFNPIARPFAPPGLIFGDNALPGKLAFAVLSLLVRASARNALM